jgi:hypothetical protein
MTAPVEIVVEDLLQNSRNILVEVEVMTKRQIRPEVVNDEEHNSLRFRNRMRLRAKRYLIFTRTLQEMEYIMFFWKKYNEKIQINSNLNIWSIIYIEILTEHSALLKELGEQACALDLIKLGHLIRKFNRDVICSLRSR